MKRYASLIAATVASLVIRAGLVPADAAETLVFRRILRSGMVLVAEKEGFFVKHGLDIKPANFTSGKQCLDTMMGGAADIATTAGDAVYGSDAGEPAGRLPRAHGNSNDNMLTAVSAKINKWTDLKGKRIGFSAGTGSEITTDMILEKGKLTHADVTLVNLRPQDMPSALASGSIDAYDTWEPHVYDGKKALGSKVKELSADGIYSETFNIAVTQDYLKTHEKLIEKFLAAMIDAEAWMKTNREGGHK